ncbi:hypothetical protein ABZ916_25935 [Streptomyces sp. NPDC046853]|uniref:hypothetical protein n=1 Tax=Streptomyces sp. NPDC046853 TaxID=3154920 RepID=UPI0033EC1B0C
MEVGEFRTVGRRLDDEPKQPEPDTATRFLLNTLANIAAWRASEASRTPAEGAAGEVAVRLTPRELEHVMRLLANDASPQSADILKSVSNDAEERLGDVSTGEWLPHKASDVLSEPHSWRPS